MVFGGAAQLNNIGPVPLRFPQYRTRPASLSFNVETAILAQADCDRITRTSRRMNTYRYTLQSPTSTLVGNRLYDFARVVKLEGIVEELKSEVAFPDIRRLVNEGDLKFSDILEWRKHAWRFRDWLQDESDRDRNALWAYHNEVRRQLGLTTRAQKLIKLFGMIAAGSASALIASKLALPESGVAGVIAGGAAGAVIDSVFDNVTAFKEWKPVVFGDWLSERIRKIESGRQ